MSTDYIEAIVVLRDNSYAVDVRNWFQKFGFGVISMRAGLLISGSESLFQAAFGNGRYADRDISVDVQIEVPAPLQHWVSSIVIRRLPSIHN